MSFPARSAGKQRGGILVLLSLCSFTVTLNLQIVSPLLVDIAREFSIPVGLAGQLETVSAIVCTVQSFLSASVIDRFPRRLVLIAGTGALAAAAAGCAVAWSFPMTVGFRVLAGIGVALLQPAVFASVADLFDYDQRGKAYSWVITTNTLAPIVGIPVGALLAEQFSWRWTWVFLAFLMGLIMVACARFFPVVRRSPTLARAREGLFRPYFQILSNRDARNSFLATVLASMFWFGWTTFLGAFFIQTFGLQTGQLAPIVAMNGVGILIGSNLGGRLGDRIGKRRMILLTVPIASFILALETNVILGVWFAAVANMLICVASSARFTSMTALISEVAPGARGAMMSLNSASLQAGSALGGALGGAVIAISGYGGFGLMLSGCGLLGAVVVAVGVRETRAAVETA